MTEKFEFFDKEPAGFSEFTNQEFEEHNISKTGHKTLKYYVHVLENDEIIGTSQGGMFNSALYISDFIIKKSYRKSGVGRKLINQIEEHAKKNNCKKIWVDTYEYQAPDFYKKNGFIEKGRIENYRGKHAKIFFEKKV
mgnify:CR=1 FL=1